MEKIGDLISSVKLMQSKRLSQKIGGSSFVISDDSDLGERWGKRLCFGVTLDGHYIQSYAIAFQERRIAKFTVGVYSKEKNSIQYNLQTEFALTDPLEKLVDEFPNNRYIPCSTVPSVIMLAKLVMPLVNRK